MEGVRDVGLQNVCHYKSYVDLCIDYDRILPNYVNNTEGMYRILRNNFTKLFTMEDDKMPTTSSTL